MCSWTSHYESSILVELFTPLIWFIASSTKFSTSHFTHPHAHRVWVRLWLTAVCSDPYIMIINAELSPNTGQHCVRTHCKRIFVSQKFPPNPHSFSSAPSKNRKWNQSPSHLGCSLTSQMTNPHTQCLARGLYLTSKLFLLRSEADLFYVGEGQAVLPPYTDWELQLWYSSSFIKGFSNGCWGLLTQHKVYNHPKAKL